MSSFCLGCGTALAEGERFCANCGRDSASTAPVSNLHPEAAFGLPPENSGKGIFSLICGLLMFFPPASIVAVVFGHLSLSDIRKGGGQLKGKGLAISGLILGYIGTAIWTVFFVMVAITIPKTMKRMQSVNATPSRGSAVSAMRTLNTAEIAYAQAHREIGYTCSLPELSKSWGLGAQLSQGRSDGYTFAIRDCSSLKPDGPITTYHIVARPIATDKRLPAYCSTESAVIKIARSGSVEDCLTQGTDVATGVVN